MKISLILSTCNRTVELEKFLEALIKSDYKKEDIELLIVDQNDKLLLNEIINKYSDYININHLKVNFKGLSKSRNYGLKYANGDIICFPDDDCWYEKDTIKNVIDSFNKNSDVDIVLGKILDQFNELCYMKDSKKYEVNKNNYRCRANSNNIFIRRKNNIIKFDEEFGIGAKYPASEDTDLIYSYLKEGKKIIYDNSIIVRHPNVDYSKISAEKIKLYSFGYGAFCRKQIDINIIYMFLITILGQFFHLGINAVRFDKEEVKKRWYSIKYRIYGFLKYKR